MKHVIKIAKYLKETGLLIKFVVETIESEAKEQKSGFLVMLIDALVGGLLGNLLTGKGIIRDGGLIIIIRGSQDFLCYLIP